MTRDMDLIRQLLLDLEAFDQRPGGISLFQPNDFHIDGYTDNQIDYHLSLIREAGFIDDGGVRPMTGMGFRRLTWIGHDFLDSVRDKTVWDKTKATASQAGGFTVDLLFGIAKEIIKQNAVKLLGAAFGS
jgi:hypothetical protein